jgi:hypothetical protein
MRACDAVLLRSPGLDDTIIFWNNLPKRDLVAGTNIDQPQYAYIEQIGERLVISGPEVAERWVPDFPPPSGGCGAW